MTLEIPDLDNSMINVVISLLETFSCTLNAINMRYDTFARA